MGEAGFFWWFSGSWLALVHWSHSGHLPVSRSESEEGGRAKPGTGRESGREKGREWVGEECRRSSFGAFPWLCVWAGYA